MLRRRHVISAEGRPPVLSGRIHGSPPSLDREFLFPPRVIRRKRCTGCATFAAELPVGKNPRGSSRAADAGGSGRQRQGRVGRTDGAAPELRRVGSLCASVISSGCGDAISNRRSAHDGARSIWRHRRGEFWGHHREPPSIRPAPGPPRRSTTTGPPPAQSRPCFTLPAMGGNPPRNKWETLFWVGYTATVALIAG
jgi:hypothetical protein